VTTHPVCSKSVMASGILLAKGGLLLPGTGRKTGREQRQENNCEMLPKECLANPLSARRRNRIVIKCQVAPVCLLLYPQQKFRESPQCKEVQVRERKRA
jgi:hypothetical protein